MKRLPYPVVCVGLGLVLGWLPVFVHGPIPAKFDMFFIDGDVAVWAYYLSRMAIGFWVGVTIWPVAWWLRGPMCGFLSMLPVTFIALATPTCGVP